jgi:hypothetical protein
VEHVIEGDPGGHIRGQLAFPGGEGFEGDPDVIVPRGLVAGKRPRVTTDIGKVWRKACQQAHTKVPDRILVSRSETAAVPVNVSNPPRFPSQRTA